MNATSTKTPDDKTAPKAPIAANHLGMFGNLGGDSGAGLVVFLVALPLCLGIALASGAPLLSGLVAGIVGGLVVGWASGSALSVSGPAAGLTVIVLGAIEAFAAPFVAAIDANGMSPEALAAAKQAVTIEKGFPIFLLAVVLAGGMQIVFGFVRAGALSNYFPSTVIKGMLAAIGAILILKQVPHLVGHDNDPEGELQFIQPDGENTFSEIWAALGDLSPAAIAIGFAGLAILIIYPKLSFTKNLKAMPAPLVVVIVGVVVNQILVSMGSEFALKGDHLVALPVFASATEVFAAVQLPDFSAIGDVAVWKSAATIAIVASVETLLCIEAIDKQDPLRRTTPVNRELKAQGLGNIISGLLGGLPLTAVIVRGSANVQSGGRTRLSAIIHGALLLIAVLLLGSIMNLIPLAALAAVLIHIGYRLAPVPLFVGMLKRGWSQFLPFIITFAAILLTDLLTGVLVGIAVGLGFILREHAKRAVEVDISERDDADGHHRVILLDHHVSFLNKAAIRDSLDAVKAGEHVDIDGREARFIDPDVLELIEDFRDNAVLRGVTVHLLGVENNLPKVGGH